MNKMYFIKGEYYEETYTTSFDFFTDKINCEIDEVFIDDYELVDNKIHVIKSDETRNRLDIFQDILNRVENGEIVEFNNCKFGIAQVNTEEDI